MSSLTYFCRACRTLFTKEGIIINKGKNPKKSPLEVCRSRRLNRIEGDYRCKSYRTKFTAEGNFIERGKRWFDGCVLEKCHGKRVDPLKCGYFRCRACGTVFTDKNHIIQEGKPWIGKCVIENCKSVDIEIKKKDGNYRCLRFGTKFTEHIERS